MLVDTLVTRSAEQSPHAVHRKRAYTIQIDTAGISTSDRLFESFATALRLPDYFGWNWNALDECFSDYFITEEGGLGSEFGGRAGIPADAVLLVFLHAGDLLRSETDLVGRLALLLNHTREVNENREAADLLVVFEVESEREQAALESALGKAT